MSTRGEAFQRVELGPDAILWQPSSDVLHVNPVVPQDEPSEAVYLGRPLGECGGVRMANDVIAALADGEGPIYGNHEPTHGADATAQHEELGAVFGVQPEDVEPDSSYVVSAHGAEPSVAERARARGLRLFDVTCPLVHHTHQAIRRAGEDGHVAYISFGKRDHAELVGAQGLAESRGTRFTVISGEADLDALVENAEGPITIVGQTTNNSEEAVALADELRGRAAAEGVEVRRGGAHDVCHTVRDRQAATREIIRLGVDSLVVVGSVNSKNTLSLAKVAAQEAAARGVPLEAYLANSWRQIPLLRGLVGVVSGASTLERNVQGVVERLAPAQGVTEVGEDTDRGIVFKPIDTATREILSIHTPKDGQIASLKVTEERHGQG